MGVSDLSPFLPESSEKAGVQLCVLQPVSSVVSGSHRRPMPGGYGGRVGGVGVGDMLGQSQPMTRTVLNIVSHLPFLATLPSLDAERH